MSKRLRTLTVVSAISTTTIIITLLSFEIYLRLTATSVIRQRPKNFIEFIESNPNLVIQKTAAGKRLIPDARAIIRNQSLSKRNIRMDINSSGFRGAEIPAHKKDDELRILVLGDSITWGDYLPEEEVYVARIQHYLEPVIKDYDVKVINAGLVDIGTKEEIDILAERGLSVKPDIVILGFYLNDSLPPQDFNSEFEERGWLRKYSLLAERVYMNVKIRKWIKEIGQYRFQWWGYTNKLDWMNDKNALLKLVSIAKYDWGAAWQKNSWKVIEQELFRLKSLSQKFNFKVIVVAFPVSFQVYANFLEDTPQQNLKIKSLEAGFYYFDLLPVLRNYRKEILYFDQCHPRENANDIIGRAIADFLIKSGLHKTSRFPELH